MSDTPQVDLREYLERIMNERHQQYLQQFAAQKEALALALAAARGTREQSNWSTGTVISVVIGVLAILVSIAVVVMSRK